MTEDQLGPAAPRWTDPDDRAPGWGEEQAIRALLHRSVEGLQPDPDALARIRRAVPARRARQRHAWTGAAVIAVITAAVPTLHGLGALQLSDGATSGGGPTHTGAEFGAPTGPARPSGSRLPLPGLPGPAPTASAVAAPVEAPASPSGAAATAPAATASAVAAHVPDCLRADLGRGGALLGTPDATGRLYGVFTVANVSGHACALADPGVISVGGAQGQVRVVAHTVGDAAAALPDPATLPARLLLDSAGSYQLSFSWVPDALCPTAGPSGGTGSGQGTGQGTDGPTPSPSPSATPGGSAALASAGPARPGAAPAGAAAGSGTTSTSATPLGPSPTAPPASPGTPVAASLTVGYQPLGAAPDAATVVIGGVCGGGTLYRSPPQAVS